MHIAAVANNAPLPASLRPIPRIPEQPASRSRLLTLDEYDGDDGNPMVMLLNHQHWSDPVTERVRLGSVEISSLANLTQDTHPIHLHMVRFQILDRRCFAVDDYLASNSSPLRFTGPALAPPAHEMGWKDVVQCPPQMVTRIIVPLHALCGTLRLALPHPGAPGEGKDAPLRHRPVDRAGGGVQQRLSESVGAITARSPEFRGASRATMATALRPLGRRCRKRDAPLLRRDPMLVKSPSRTPG